MKSTTPKHFSEFSRIYHSSMGMIACTFFVAFSLLTMQSCGSGSCGGPTEVLDLNNCQILSFPFNGSDTIKFKNDGKIHTFIGQGIRTAHHDAQRSCGCDCPTPLSIEKMKLTLIGDTFNLFLELYAKTTHLDIDNGGLNITSSPMYRTTGVYDFLYKECNLDLIIDDEMADSMEINGRMFYDVYHNYNKQVCYNLSEGLIKFQIGYGATAHSFVREF